MSDDLRTYIREHRTTYTRDALTAELVTAGHATADIEAAWAQVEAEDAAAAARGPVGWVAAEERPYVRGARTVLAMVIVGLAYIGSALWFLSAGAFSSNVIVVWLYTVATIAAAAFLLRRLGRATSASVVTGTFLLAVVLYVGLAGACIGGILLTFQLH